MVTVVVATVAGGVWEVVVGGGVPVVGGGEVVVECVGQPSGSTYCESPAEPGHPLPDPASAAPAPSPKRATTHVNKSPSLLMTPVLQARKGVVAGDGHPWLAGRSQLRH